MSEPDMRIVSVPKTRLKLLKTQESSMKVKVKKYSLRNVLNLTNLLKEHGSTFYSSDWLECKLEKSA